MAYRNRDDVTLLVQALSNGEKRYFTNYCKTYNSLEEPPLFFRLFQLLERGESDLQNHLQSGSPQGLTLAKRRLYTNLMKALRGLHENRSVENTIQNQLSEIEILYRLGLPEQALFVLRKAYGEARKHERFGLVLQILEWEKKLNIVLDNLSRPIGEIVAEEKKVLSMLGQIMELESIYSFAKDQKKQYGLFKGRKAVERLKKGTIHAPNMPTLEACQSDKAVYYYNFIHSLYYWMVFDHEKAYGYSRHLVETSLKQVLPNDYIDGIFEHITSCVCVGRFGDALGGIELGAAYVEEQKLSQSHAFMLKMFAYKCTYRIIVYNYMGERRKLLDTIAETESSLKQFEKILPFEIRQVITGNLMNAYMGTGNLQMAEQIWDSLFNRQSQSVRLDIYADLYLFRLFSLLNFRNFHVIPSFALSAVRFYRKHQDAKSQYEVELAIALLLQKQEHLEQKDNLRRALCEMRGIVEQFISRLKGIRNFQEHYTRYIIWCDAILRDEPFYTAAQRWYAGYVQEHGGHKKRAQ